jgi:hypothetical protein
LEQDCPELRGQAKIIELPLLGGLRSAGIDMIQDFPSLSPD